jgi:hypothetical protein
MEESRFHIKLKKLQAVNCDYTEEKSEGYHRYNWQEDFVEVNVVFLSKSLGYNARLILGAEGIECLFESKDLFVQKCFPIPWKFHQVPSLVFSDGVYF